MSIKLEVSGLLCGWRNKKKIIPILEIKNKIFEIEKNFGILPIFGRTGFGKTTLLHILSGIMPPLTGEINWYLPNNVNLRWSHSKQIDNSLRSKYFGIMMQGADLPRFMTIGESIKLMIQYQTKTLDPKKTKILEKISKFCLKNEDPKVIAKSYPSNLSGGQRQRMALAYALANDPTILFADEPTGALDKNTRKEVLNALGNWLQKGKRSIVFVSHHEEDPNFIYASKDLSDQIKICRVIKDMDDLKLNYFKPSQVEFY